MSMHYEIVLHPGSTEDYVTACQSCATLLLSRVPEARSHPEPAAPCQLRYEGVCDHGA
jgi:hypothetical protein